MDISRSQEEGGQDFFVNHLNPNQPEIGRYLPFFVYLIAYGWRSTEGYDRNTGEISSSFTFNVKRKSSFIKKCVANVGVYDSENVFTNGANPKTQSYSPFVIYLISNTRNSLYLEEVAGISYSQTASRE